MCHRVPPSDEPTEGKKITNAKQQAVPIDRNIDLDKLLS